MTLSLPPDRYNFLNLKKCDESYIKVNQLRDVPEPEPSTCYCYYMLIKAEVSLLRAFRIRCRFQVKNPAHPLIGRVELLRTKKNTSSRKKLCVDSSDADVRHDCVGGGRLVVWWSHRRSGCRTCQQDSCQAARLPRPPPSNIWQQPGSGSPVTAWRRAGRRY